MAESKISVKLEADGAAKFVADLNKAESAVKKFQSSIKGISGNGSLNTGGITGALGKLDKSMSGTLANARRFSSGLGGAFSTIATGALLKVGSILVDLGIKFAKFAVDTAKFAVTSAGDFEQAIQKFTAIGGKDVAGSVDSFKGLFKSFAKQGVDGIEAANAGIELLKGGLAPAIIQQGALKDALNLSRVGFIDNARAAEIIANQYAAWGQRGVTTTQIVDTLSRVADSSTVGVDDLALGMANATNSLATFNDTALGVSFIRSAFTSARDAGTGYRNFLNNMQPTTKSAIAAQKELGLWTKRGGSAFFDAKGEYIGNAKAAELLERAVKGLTKEEQQRLLKQAFSSDGQRAATALIEKGSAAYRQQEAAQAASASAAQKAAKFNEGFNAILEATSATAKNAAIDFGTALLPALTGFANNALIPGIELLGKWGKALFDAGGAGDNFLKAIAPISNGIAQFIADLAGGADFGTALKKQLGKIDIGAIIRGAFGKIGGFNFGSIFSGIGSAVSSINPTLGAAVAQFGGTLNQLVNIASRIAARLAETFSSIGPGLLTGLGQILSGASTIISGILTFLSGLGAGVSQIFQGDILGGLETVGAGFFNAIGGIEAGLRTAFSGILSTVATFALGFFQLITGVDVSGAVADWTRAFLVLPTVIAGVQSAVGGFFTGLADAFVKFKTGDFSGAAEAFKAAFDGIPAAISGIKANVQAELAKIDATTPKPIVIPPPDTSQFASGIAQVQQQASGAGTATVTPITIPAPNTAPFTAGIAQVQQQAATLGTTAATPIVIPAPDTSSFASAVTAAQSTVAQIRSAFSGVSLNSQGAAMGVSLATGIRSQTGLVSAAARGLVTAARSAASGVAGGFSSIGAQIANGVAAGIRGSMGGVIAAAVAMVTRAKAAAEAAAGINSPAKEWKPLGKYMGLGTGVGFVDSIKSVNRMIDGGMRQMAFSAGRVNAPATVSRSYSRTINNTSQSSTTRNMPVTIINSGSNGETLSSLVLQAAMGQI